MLVWSVGMWWQVETNLELVIGADVIWRAQKALESKGLVQEDAKD